MKKNLVLLISLASFHLQSMGLLIPGEGMAFVVSAAFTIYAQQELNTLRDKKIIYEELVKALYSFKSAKKLRSYAFRLGERIYGIQVILKDEEARLTVYAGRFAERLLTDIACECAVTIDRFLHFKKSLDENKPPKPNSSEFKRQEEQQFFDQLTEIHPTTTRPLITRYQWCVVGGRIVTLTLGCLMAYTAYYQHTMHNQES